MPPPGSTKPARLTVELRDLIWDALYKPIATGVNFAAEHLNHLQFLTIRNYLSLVFAALVLLLLVQAYGRDPRHSLAGGPDAAGALIGAAAHRLCAQGESPAAAAARSAPVAAISRPHPAHAQRRRSGR